ncbi:hypothetical protein M432DRAFT_612903 [Thermoascus aurantiacus ATCC 26904]
MWIFLARLIRTRLAGERRKERKAHQRRVTCEAFLGLRCGCSVAAQHVGPVMSALRASRGASSSRVSASPRPFGGLSLSTGEGMVQGDRRKRPGGCLRSSLSSTWTRPTGQYYRTHDVASNRQLHSCSPLGAPPSTQRVIVGWAQAAPSTAAPQLVALPPAVARGTRASVVFPLHVGPHLSLLRPCSPHCRWPEYSAFDPTLCNARAGAIKGRARLSGVKHTPVLVNSPPW